MQACSWENEFLPPLPGSPGEIRVGIDILTNFPFPACIYQESRSWQLRSFMSWEVYTKEGQSPRSSCFFLCAFWLSEKKKKSQFQHPDCQWLQHPAKGMCLGCVSFTPAVAIVVAQGWAQRPWWNSPCPVYFQKDFLEDRLPKQSHPSFPSSLSSMSQSPSNEWLSDQ